MVFASLELTSSSFLFSSSFPLQLSESYFKKLHSRKTSQNSPACIVKKLLRDTRIKSNKIYSENQSRYDVCNFDYKELLDLIKLFFIISLVFFEVRSSLSSDEAPNADGLKYEVRHQLALIYNLGE